MGSSKQTAPAPDPSKPRQATKQDDQADNPAASHTSVPESPDSFIKIAWYRFLDLFGAKLFSRMSPDELEQFNHERGYNRFVKENLDKYPEGFPRLAALTSCDNSLAMHRSFNYCHNRILLRREVEITKLEKKLYDLDMKDASDPDKEYRLRSTHHENGWDPAQIVLMDELEGNLKNYVEIVRNHVYLQELGKPPSRNHRSYFNWHWTNKPLCSGDYDYIFHDSDFVNTSGKKPNYCEELIRDHIYSYPRSPLRGVTNNEKTIMKERKETSWPTKDKRLTFFSSTAEKLVGRFFLVSTIMVILMIPVSLLLLVPMSHLIMTVTTAIFITLFALISSIVTDNKVYEVFVGTTIYGAVLIVFLGIVSQNSPATGM